jgi:hypothetical protein
MLVGDLYVVKWELLTHSDASKTVPFGASYFFGAANLNSPTGASAYRMPKNSVTCVLSEDGWPIRVPLDVSMLEPFFGAATAEPNSEATAATVRRRCCIIRNHNNHALDGISFSSWWATSGLYWSEM